MRVHKDANMIFESQLYNNDWIIQRMDEIRGVIYKTGLHVKKLAIALDRSPDLLITILVALELRITYLLIDLNQPFERIQNILYDVGIDLILTEERYEHLFVNYQTIQLKLINQRYSFNSNFYNHENTISYILFTSGSSGQPKGVQVTRKAVFNFIEGISNVIDFSPKKRIACLTAATFDIFFLESIMAFYKGLSVILANEDEQCNPRLMANLLIKNNVNMIQMTPSKIRLLLNYDKNLLCLKNVKEILIGGEPFPLSLLRALQEKTNAKIYNMYGPTESTIWSTVSELTTKNRIDIGYPILNTKIYIVDKDLLMLKNGQVGEICIAGLGLAKGYIARDDLTLNKFVFLPQQPLIRVYRTGDLGKILLDGTIEYHGRIDNQVKIRGHRIELEEIEKQLNEMEGLQQSVVCALEISENDKILIAFYMAETDFVKKEFTTYLSQKLPSYMIPVIYQRIENFVYTANGKIDRHKILKLAAATYEKTADLEKEERTSRKLSDISGRAFDVIYTAFSQKIKSKITEDVNLDNIGVDSVTFVKAVVALEVEFGIDFDDEMLLIKKFSTIKSLIEYVEMKVLENNE